jgi:hypothetical protein
MLFPTQCFCLFSTLTCSESLLGLPLPRIQEGIREDYFFLRGLRRDRPLLGSNESAFCEPGIEGVELVDEAFVDFRALSAGVEVLERFEDVPVVSAW